MIFCIDISIGYRDSRLLYRQNYRYNLSITKYYRRYFVFVWYRFSTHYIRLVSIQYRLGNAVSVEYQCIVWVTILLYKKNNIIDDTSNSFGIDSLVVFAWYQYRYRFDTDVSHVNRCIEWESMYRLGNDTFI